MECFPESYLSLRLGWMGHQWTMGNERMGMMNEEEGQPASWVKHMIRNSLSASLDSLLTIHLPSENSKEYLEDGRGYSRYITEDRMGFPFLLDPASPHLAPAIQVPAIQPTRYPLSYSTHAHLIPTYLSIHLYLTVFTQVKVPRVHVPTLCARLYLPSKAR